MIIIQDVWVQIHDVGLIFSFLGADAKFTPRGSIVFKTLRSSVASLARDVSLTSEEYEKLEVILN